MSQLDRVVRRTLGGDVPAQLRPLLSMTTAAVLGQWMLSAYLPIYLATQLSISAATAGTVLAAAAATGLVVGPVAGRVSDRRGPLPVLTVSMALQGSAGLLPLLDRGRIGAAAAAVALAAGFTTRTAIQNALAATLAHDGERDHSFALLRTAVNVSAAAGPALGSALLLVGWRALWAGSLLATAAACSRIRRLGHEVGTYDRASVGSGTTTARGRPAGSVPIPSAVAVAVVGNALAWTVYNGFEILLPVAIVAVYHLSPSLWGLVFLINPISVVLLQLRLTRWTAHLTRRARLSLATGLLGGSFPPLLISHRLGVIAFVVAVFSTGEILWGPASQSLVADLTPPARIGTAMGLMSASATAGAAITSAAGLPLLAHGPRVTWTVMVAIAAGSALLFRLAGRFEVEARPADPRPRRVGSGDSVRRGHGDDRPGEACTGGPGPVGGVRPLR